MKKAFDLNKYSKYSEQELAQIRIGTVGLLASLSKKDVVKSAQRASSFTRSLCHGKSKRSRLNSTPNAYRVYKGRFF